MQTIQIPAYGKLFEFLIPAGVVVIEPMLDDETQTCVLILDGDVYSPDE